MNEDELNEVDNSHVTITISKITELNALYLGSWKVQIITFCSTLKNSNNDSINSHLKVKQ